MIISSDTSLEVMLDHHLISKRTYNCLLNTNHKTLGDVMIFADPLINLLKIPKFGKKSLTEISHVVKLIGSSIDTNGYQTNEHPISIYERMIQSLHSSYLENLQNHYEDLISAETDKRCQRIIIKHMPTIQTAVSYIDAEYYQLMKIFHNQAMENTLTKIQTFTNKLKPLLQSTAKKSLLEVSLENIKHDNPFFTDSECQFYYGFSQRYHYEPVLYKTYIYLSRNKLPSFMYYKKYIDFKNNEDNTIQQVSSINNCTYEKKRRKIRKTPLINDKSFPFPMDLSCYPRLMTSTYLVDTSPFYEMIRNRELNDISFRMLCHLIMLFGNHTIIEIEGYYILINKKVSDVEVIRSMIKSLTQLLKKKYSHDTTVDIQSILSNYQDEATRNELHEMCQYICTQIFKCDYLGNTEYVVKQNHIDISYDLYQILKSKGSPMKIDELFTKFKEKYPTHKYTHSKQIRNHLYRHPLIKAIGKKSKYGLANWNKVFYGNIIDLIIKNLESASSPLRLKDIWLKVSCHFPETKVKNIYSIMMADSQKRIVHYTNGYYGLKGREYDSSFKLL